MRFAESIDEEKFVIATYYLETPMELEKAAEALAAEQSTGTWVRVAFESDELIAKYSARVLEVEKLGESNGINRGRLKLAFPHGNFGACLPMLLTTTAGNLFEMGEFRNIKLLDLEFPESYLKSFKGPKFGIRGCMKALGIRDRPMIGTIIKPCVGLPPKKFAEACYLAAKGGVDFIKDDELIANPAYSPIEERVSATMEMLDRADEEKGEKTMYAVNITDEVDRMMDNADAALENGANCLMVNFITAGFSALRMVCEDPSVNVPVHCHRDMFAAFTRSEVHGISTVVVSKLARLAGGDQVHVGAILGKLYESVEQVVENAEVLKAKMGSLRRALPVSSGGQHPGKIPANIRYLGKEVLILAGGGIHAHPAGPEAGARAMRQATEAVLAGVPLEEYAKEHEELRQAIEKWGVYER